MSLQKTQKQTENEITSINVSCCVFSIVTHLVVSVYMIAAEDILAGTHVPTSTVLMVDIGPASLVPLIFPYFIDRVPYLVRIVTIIICHVTTCVVLGLVTNVYVKLLAVSLTALATGVADITILSLTSYFKPSALSWYSTGSGAGFISGAVYYTGMATWLRISPSITLLTLAPFALLYLVCYYFISKEITKDEPKSVTKDEVAYTIVDTSDNEDDDDSKHGNAERFSRNNILSFKDKLKAVKKMAVLLGIPLFMISMAEFTLYESIITTIAYPNSPFPPRDHYQYYSLALMIGEVLGRSHRSILQMVKPDWLFTPKAFVLGLLAAIESLILIFLFFESWYRFLPGVVTVILLCFFAGFINGVAFISGIELVRVSTEDNEREFAFSISILPMTSGILVGALIGLYVEPNLMQHCILTLTDSAYCFTRHTKLSL